MFDFVMPALGADMDKGKVTEWYIKPGDVVKRGDIVADVETDKGTIEVEIWQPGTVSEILVPKGQQVKVGVPLARLCVPHEQEQASMTPSQPAVAAEDWSKKEIHPQVVPIPIPSVAQAGQGSMEPRLDHVRASPLAKRIAKELGVDLALVKGSGADGAITRADVETWSQSAVKGKEFVIPTPTMPPVKDDRSETMRKAVGQVMARSKREIPHYYLETTVSMDAALKWLTQENLERSVTDRLLPVVLVLKTVALAVKRVPEMSGRFEEGAFHLAPHVNLGVAISLRGGGLVAPALHQAAEKTLPELMRDLMDLILRARSGKLRSSEITDPTITVTNLGDTGVDTVYGVIHPPQVAMVGVGRIRDQVVPVNGLIGISKVQTITLSADHRVSDGHRGALFLGEVSRLLQDPQLL